MPRRAHILIIMIVTVGAMTSCQAPNVTDYRSPAGATGQSANSAAALPSATVAAGSTVAAGTISGATTSTDAGATDRLAVSFPGSKGDSINGFLSLPVRTAGQRFPAVLIMYGISGDKNDSTIQKAGQILSAAGIISLTFDWPGTGDRGKIDNQVRITDKSWMEWTVADYAAALKFLKSQPSVDSAHLGYVGASMGAMTGIVFTSRTPEIRAIAALVPILNPLWLDDDPSLRIRQIAPRPVLCISSNGDMGASQLVCSGVTNHVHLNVEHELDGQEETVINQTRDFLKTSL